MSSKVCYYQKYVKCMNIKGNLSRIKQWNDIPFFLFLLYSATLFKRFQLRNHYLNSMIWTTVRCSKAGFVQCVLWTSVVYIVFIKHFSRYVVLYNFLKVNSFSVLSFFTNVNQITRYFCTKLTSWRIRNNIDFKINRWIVLLCTVFKKNTKKC